METTVSSIKAHKAKKAVKSIMEELKTRKGFDELFNLIEPPTMAELTKTLTKIVEDNI